MSDEEDYNSEEDQDYVPSEGEQVSEEENSGDEEDLTLLQEDGETPSSPKKKRGPKGKKKKVEEISIRKRKGGIKLDQVDPDEEAEILQKEHEKSAEEERRRKELAEETAKEEEERKKEREKKRADDLWSSFMSDVKKAPPRKPANSGSSLASLTGTIKAGSSEESKGSNLNDHKSPAPAKVTITKVFDFAGEEIKVTKEVDANSKEAIAEQKKQEKAEQEPEKNTKPASFSSLSSSSSPLLSTSSARPDLKRPAVGGLGSVLNKINKKSKMGTLEKSKIDWDSFKKNEGIEEDLKIHNKGKQGYMERMAFLNRADQRQYELERDIRLSTSKR